jgi:hypothetical protein
MAHVRQPDTGCAIPTLGAEIARADIAVREQAEHWLLQLQQAWAAVLDDDALAWAILAQCVGALLLARMLATSGCQEQVLSASKDLLGSVLASRPATG